LANFGSRANGRSGAHRFVVAILFERPITRSSAFADANKGTKQMTNSNDTPAIETPAKAPKAPKAKPAPKAAKAAKAKPTAKAAAAKPAPKAAKAPAVKADAKPAKSKVDIIAALLTREGGCTGADILKATGWPSVSVPQQAKAAGLTLHKSKKPGEPTRYTAKA
jgi:Protein of unknown function (DUF3489)